MWKYKSDQHIYRKNIFFLVIFIFAALYLIDKCLFWVGREIISYSSYRYTSFYEKRFQEKDKINVVVIGNSRADQDFPRYEYNGKKYLNLGNSWLGVPVSSATALDVLKYQIPPEFLIIETAFFDYQGTGRAYGAIQNIFSDAVEDASLLDSTNFERHARKIFYVLRFNENDLINALVRMMIPDTRNIASYDRIINDDLKKRALSEGRTINLRARNKVTLLNLIEKYKQANVTVYLVSTPMHPVGIESYSNLSDFLFDVDRLAQQAGIRHINLTDIYSADRLFSDTTHLNSFGQKRFLKTFDNCFLQSNPKASCNWDQ